MMKMILVPMVSMIRIAMVASVPAMSKMPREIFGADLVHSVNAMVVFSPVVAMMGIVAGIATSIVTITVAVAIRTTIPIVNCVVVEV